MVAMVTSPAANGGGGGGCGGGYCNGGGGYCNGGGGGGGGGNGALPVWPLLLPPYALQSCRHAWWRRRRWRFRRNCRNGFSAGASSAA
jgi:hypothetical protein